MSRSGLAKFLASVLLFAAPAVAQTTPADLCTGNPCQITINTTLDPGSPAADLVLDFGAVPLVFKSTAKLTIGGAGGQKVTFRARSITMDPGAQILGAVDYATVVLESTAGSIAVNATGATKAKIVVDSNAAGGIALRATGGDVTVNGILSAQAGGEDAFGGDITLFGDTVTVATDLDAQAGGFSDLDIGSGGNVTVVALNDVTLLGAVDVSASDGTGGAVALFSFNGSVVLNGQIKADGDGPEGAGGSIAIGAATGGVSVGAALSATGSSGTDDGDPVCGDGGTVLIRAKQTLTLGADVKLSGGANCAGGYVSLDPANGTPIAVSAAFITDADLIQQPGTAIDAHGSGYNEDDFDCGSGGDVYLAAKGNLSLQTIDVSASCEAGTIAANAGSAVTVVGRLDASTSGSDTTGGHVSVRGCSVSVPLGSKIDTRGDIPGSGNDGKTLVQASGALIIAGNLSAQIENRLEYKTLPPITVGATINPGATVAQNPTLPDCAGVVDCGDGIRQPTEACDDGNIVDCDGCRGDCSRPDHVCGDGIVECGEACDDGNTANGDGCSSTCTREGPGVLEIEGTPRQSAGCLAEWEVRMSNGVLDATTGRPKRTQRCIDGDPACDRDGSNDLRCSFDVQICLRRTDGLIPGCHPQAIASVKVSSPNPLTATGVYLTDAQAMANALHALGVQVTAGTEIVFPGSPQAAQNNCTPRFTILVPHSATSSHTRVLRIAAKDTNALSMDRNELYLACYPNHAVCGNGVVEPFEGCDDHNTAACDGCSPDCHLEVCGNGVLDCGEECDDGPLNGTSGDRCSTACKALPPALRIPGGGSRSVDCAYEWSTELNPGQLLVDAHGLPRNRQVCTDNDPLCDLDPTPGTCRMRVWACLGGADARLVCSAARVTAVDISNPKATAGGSQLQARLALFNGLQALGLPTGPGEECTSPADVDVRVGRAGKLKFKTKAKLESGSADLDQLSLECRAQ